MKGGQMSKEQVKKYQEEGINFERQANDLLGDVRDPILSTRLSDGRSLRTAIQELTEHYQERLEQLLWTKWGQRMERSESKVLLGDLAAARARYYAVLSDLDDSRLDVESTGNLAPSSMGATSRTVTERAIQVERDTMALAAKALEGVMEKTR
jgi:hypothetical protein